MRGIVCQIHRCSLWQGGTTTKNRKIMFNNPLSVVYSRVYGVFTHALNSWAFRSNVCLAWLIFRSMLNYIIRILITFWDQTKLICWQKTNSWSIHLIPILSWDIYYTLQAHNFKNMLFCLILSGPPNWKYTVYSIHNLLLKPHYSCHYKHKLSGLVLDSNRHWTLLVKFVH